MSRNPYKNIGPLNCTCGTEWILTDHRLPEPLLWYLVYGCRLKPSEPSKKPEFEDYTIHLAFMVNKKWYDIFTAPVFAKYWMKLPVGPEEVGGARPEKIHPVIDPEAPVYE